MPSETMMRVFKLQDESGVSTYPVRDSHINIAYGECQTAAATAAKVVTLTNDPGWKLIAGSFVVVHFTNAVPANATLNVADTGARNIYLKNQPVTGVILAGDIVTFIYNGTNYIVTAIDRVVSDINNKLNTSLKGSAGGVAELDASGKVPSSQLPSYVDDVLEYDKQSSFPATGETGKIYVAKDTNKTYRWSGTAYVEISPSLALGETSSTAYRGDRGKTAYDHASAKGSAFASGLYKITTNSEGHVTAATAVAKSDITGLGIPGQDTTYSSKAAASGGTDVSLVTTGEKYNWNNKASTSTATTSANGLMSSSDKAKLDGIASGATANTGTVTNIATGAGLTGGAITTSGTVKANLTSEVNLSNAAADGTETTGRVYPVRLDKNGKLAVNVPWTDNNTTYTFDGTYNASTNKAATVSTVTNAINTLDGNLNNTTPGAGKTLTAFSETNGVVSATFGNISITKSQVSDFPTLGAAAAKGVTDNSSATAVTSTDTNLITGRTLYYAGYTKNAGTITGINMNGASKGTSGVVDLGTVITAHQDISGKADKSSTVSNVAYDSTNKKITKTINGTTSDVVTAATLKTAMSLGNVENKSSATIRDELTSSNVTTALGFTPLNASLKGANNGVAELDSAGKVPASQLPSYVDDVLEYDKQSSFPATGETGKIYIAQDTNKTYRWSGTAYVEISASLALGETSSTAYRGDRGKTAYDHASAKGSAFASGLYKITTNSEGHVTAATAVAKSDITGLGIPGSDTNTHRPIQVNGTEVLGNNTTALNLKAGSNVTVTNSSGTVTIAATDTTYTAATAAPGNIATSGAQGSSTNYARQDHTHGIALATGDSNGQVKIAGNNVSVKGLGSAAYTNSNAYAVNGTLTSEDLDSVVTPGFYNAGGGNMVTNKPSGFDSFGLVVIHTAAGSYYTQIIIGGSRVSYRRHCSNGTWSSWTLDKYTDTNTTYTLTQDSSDGHKITFTPSSGSATTITIPDNNTDTKVTSSANHYTPATASGSNVTASASGASAAWSIDVVKGVTLNTDGKGHVTGMSVTSGKIPSNPNTDTHRPIKVNGTEILGNNLSALNLKAGSNVSITNSSGTVTIEATDTTYSDATTSASGLMSSGDKTKLNGIATGATANIGTITGINMNGASKGTSGVVDLGTVITAHQDISGKADVSDVASTDARIAVRVGQGSVLQTVDRAISAGTYFHHTGLDKLYIATNNIIENGTIVSSGPNKNVREITNGGMNELSEGIKQATEQLDSESNVTNDILADALLVTRTTFFRGSGSSYTGDVPNSSFYHGSFIVNLKSNDRHVIAVSQNGQMAVNTYYSGSWLGWQEPYLNDGEDWNRSYSIVKIINASGIRLSFSGQVAGKITFVGSAASRCGEGVFFGRTSSCAYKAASSVNGVTVTPGTGQIDIVTTETSNVYVTIWVPKKSYTNNITITDITT